MAEEFHPEQAITPPPQTEATVSNKKLAILARERRESELAKEPMSPERLRESLSALEREQKTYNPANNFENFRNKLAELDAKIAEEKDPKRAEVLQRVRNDAAKLTDEEKEGLYNKYENNIRKLAEAHPEPQPSMHDVTMQEHSNTRTLKQRLEVLGIQKVDALMDNGDLIQVLLFAKKPEEMLGPTRKLMSDIRESMLDPNTSDAAADRSADMYRVMKEVEGLSTQATDKSVPAAERATSAMKLKDLQNTVRELQLAEGTTAQVSPEVSKRIAEEAERIPASENITLKTEVTDITRRIALEKMSEADRALQAKVDKYAATESELARLEHERIKGLMSEVSPINVDELLNADVPSLLLSQSESPEELGELAFARLNYLKNKATADRKADPMNLNLAAEDAYFAEKFVLKDIIDAANKAFSEEVPSDEQEKMRGNLKRLRELMLDYRVQRHVPNYEREVEKILRGDSEDTAKQREEAEALLKSRQRERFENLTENEKTEPDIEQTAKIKISQLVPPKSSSSEEVFESPQA